MSFNMNSEKDGVAASVEGFREVTKEQFFSHIGSKDVHPNNHREDRTIWETPGREVLGVSFPGWNHPGQPRQYFIPDAALSLAKGGK